MIDCYLDNSATTRVSDAAREAVVRAMTEDYGNPSSLHTRGMEAEKIVRHAKEQIAATLRAKPDEIIFTSGGTESNNMAILGGIAANRRKGNHVITTAVEHASVGKVVDHLREEGLRVTELPVDQNGRVRAEDLLAALDDETVLVSIMMVNNEIGAVNPVAELGKLVHEKVPGCLFHVDAIQAYGKFRIVPSRMNIDLLSVSGHKIHGPKGIGFLYVRDGVRVAPILYGGGQQKGLRSGTDNVPGAAGLGVAAEECYTDFDKAVEALYHTKEIFLAGIAGVEGCHVNGLTGRDSAPQIVSVSFDGVRAEVLLHALEEKGIYVSAGSACSSNHPAVSRTLKGIGVKKEYLDSTLRFSFSRYTTAEEIDTCMAALKELLPFLRRYSRR